MTNPIHYLKEVRPHQPVMFFCPTRLQYQLKRFQNGFPGLVTYAVKSNPSDQVLKELIAAGISGFDVASLNEVQRVRALSDSVVMHYNNPIRSDDEITEAYSLGIRSFAVDRLSELNKLARLVDPRTVEVSIRFKLDIAGAAYDFNSKFGANSETAITLLKRSEEYGFTPSLTFHPGTQCNRLATWQGYISLAAQIVERAKVTIKRLNVGGGFPAQRNGQVIELETIFKGIVAQCAKVFGEDVPQLICEPGRAMVADAFELATQVKAIDENNEVFLNDGIYGALSECRDLGTPARAVVVREGHIILGECTPRTVFGPTCDSLDSLGTIPLPASLEVGDYLVFPSVGAYSTILCTAFNGYGALNWVRVDSSVNTAFYFDDSACGAA